MLTECLNLKNYKISFSDVIVKKLTSRGTDSKIIRFINSYPKVTPYRFCDGIYSDPNFNFLNSGDGSNSDTQITKVNSIEWNGEGTKFDYKPSLDLEGAYIVMSVKVSFIANSAFYKYAPK